MGTKPWTGVKKDNTFNRGRDRERESFHRKLRPTKPINNAEKGLEQRKAASL
jgi:hypothetical protein